MPTEGLSEEQIKHMVGRFLSWRLPENFRPDAGISFKAEFNENTPWPMKHEPVGTNLFSADQATQMVRHMVEGLPRAEGPAPPGGAETALRKLLAPADLHHVADHERLRLSSRRFDLDLTIGELRAALTQPETPDHG